MTQSDFFDEFQDATLVKLEIIRLYFIEWISLFFAKSRNTAHFKHIYICDFFAGRGSDNAGNLGTAGIILEEIKNHSQNRKAERTDTPVSIILNELNKENYGQLCRYVADYVEGSDELRTLSDTGKIKIVPRNKPFRDVLDDLRAGLESKDSACLLILDQFGLKDVSCQVFDQLIRFPHTDILFFVPSSFVRRFGDQQCISDIFDGDVQSIIESPPHEVHRRLCETYRRRIPAGTDYYLAPFSIKKSSNYYGLIFGSGHLRGVDKFLDVAWKIDKETGEANYNIDTGSVRPKTPSLFPEGELSTKLDVFKGELVEYIAENRRTNHDIYRFSLENGFCIRKVNEILKELSNAGTIEVLMKDSGLPAQKNAFYLRSDEEKVSFIKK